MTSDLHQRAGSFAFASLLASYPDGDFEEAVTALGREWLAGHPAAVGLCAHLGSAGGLDDLRSTYVELFDRGGQRTSLYETEYGRMTGMSKGTDLADIAGFYRAFGLRLASDEVHELVDHLAVELEFYSMLLVKQGLLEERCDAEGCAIVEDARKKFLTDHLGRFVSAVAERQNVKDSPVYGPALAWTSALVAEECGRLGVTPTPLDFFPDLEAGEEMKCGSVHLPVLS